MSEPSKKAKIIMMIITFIPFAILFSIFFMGFNHAMLSKLTEPPIYTIAVFIIMSAIWSVAAAVFVMFCGFGLLALLINFHEEITKKEDNE